MTGERANLLIPAELVPRLDIPPVALSTGEPDPVWLDLPVSRSPLARRPEVRLPYDQATATALRRRRRNAPLILTFALLALVLYAVQLGGAAEIPPGVHLFSSAGLCVAGLAQVYWQTPSLPVGIRGDLYLAAVPAPLAEQWIERNPGVRPVDRRPVARRFRPRVYTVAAVLSLIAAVQVVIVLANDGVEDPVWLWLTVPGLVAAAVTLAYKSIPFEHVRFVR